MVDQLIMMSMQLVQELSTRVGNLNEFEHEMYENACRMIASHCKGMRLITDINNIELEQDLTHRVDYENQTDE